MTSTGIQVHGGMGFVEETGAAQYLRDARITTIYEGTTGIQANDLIGRKVALEKGATAKAVITEMRALDGELASDASLAPIRAALAAGVKSLEEATGWLVATYPKDAKAASASAVPYLKLCGIVAGGWQMARAALIAQKQLAAQQGDAEFYSAKLVTARFYAEHILPQAAFLGQTVVNGADSVLALDTSQF